MLRLLPPEALITAFHAAVVSSLDIFGKVIKYFGMAASCFSILSCPEYVKTFLKVLLKNRMVELCPKYEILSTKFETIPKH